MFSRSALTLFVASAMIVGATAKIPLRIVKEVQLGNWDGIAPGGW